MRQARIIGSTWEKYAHTSTQARKHASTQTRKHVNTQKRQAREHASTQVRQVRDLADSLVCYITWLDAKVDDLQTRPLGQILLFLQNNGSTD